jgi:ribosomal protein S18 acetylase RimI-like enzyme
MGWVGSLSVRRPWRRKGLAVTLLQHTFAEFQQRGQRKVGLTVDSSSLTGATRVYERAGMQTDQRTAVYSKVLRDGVELSTESLDQ